MNIAKAFIICRGRQRALPSIGHGINEIPAGVKNQNIAHLQFWRSPNARGQLQVFDEFMQALGAPRLGNGQTIPFDQILPQIVPGHRLWAAATNQRERFIAAQRVQFVENRAAKRSWIRLYLFQDDIKRLGYTQNDTLTLSGLGATFRKVRSNESAGGRALICLEQNTSDGYVRHGVDLALLQAQRVRQHLWATVASASPYRRYYLYLGPLNEQAARVPQLASIYALSFYFGSLTRYRPNEFQSLLNGIIGPRVEDFVSGQPPQFMYLMASEFARRDITKPAIL
jgi:hypothetical protein